MGHGYGHRLTGQRLGSDRHNLDDSIAFVNGLHLTRVQLKRTTGSHAEALVERYAAEAPDSEPGATPRSALPRYGPASDLHPLE